MNLVGPHGPQKQADFYTRSPQDATAAAGRLAVIEEELLGLLERWEALGG